MKYQVILPGKTQKELKKIDETYRLKINTALAVLSNNPFMGKKLEGNYKKQWSYKIWPYRIIYEIEKKNLIILIVKNRSSSKSV